MCARVSFSNLFTSSIRKAKATDLGRNSGSRKPKESCLKRRKLKECISFPTLHGFQVDPVIWSWQKQIVNALHLGERRRASTLLSHIDTSKHTLSANHFAHILGYCASTPDPLFVMEIWRVMEEKGIDLNNKCQLLMIQALCKGGYIEEAFNLMSVCGETSSLYPTLAKYNHLLEASAHSVTHANKCLDLMERDMMGKDEITYRQLLKLAVSQKNLSAVHGIWKECTRYYSHNLFSLGKFIWSFTKLGDLEAGFKALQKQVDLVVQGWFVIRSAGEKLSIPRLDIPIPFDTDLDWSRCRQVNLTSPFVHDECERMGSQASIVDGYMVGGFNIENVENAKKVLHERQLIPVMKVLRCSFNDVLLACAKAKNYELAEQLFFQMQCLGLEPSRVTCYALINVLVRKKGFRCGIEMLKLMQQKNLKPYDSTLATISISCSKSLELDLAEAILDQISKCTHVYPYNAVLEACDTLDQPERAVQVFRKLKQLKLAPDIRTYELLFSLFGNVNAPYEDGNILSQVNAAKRIKAIEDDMMRNGIDHSYLSIRNLLKALGMEGMIRELLHYLRMAEDQFAHSNSSLGIGIYTLVLHFLVEANESHMAIEIFRSMLSCGYCPIAATYTVMIDCCSISGSFKSALGLIGMMIRHGYMPTVHTYTALIKILVELENFDEALILLNQACSEEIQPDVLLFDKILRDASWKGRIDIIEFVVGRMHESKITPDPSTCSHVFSAYANNGYSSMAMEALQVMSIHMISQEEEDIDKKKTMFEDDFIYAEDLEAESRILELFKAHKENLAAGLLNLRWCAILGHPISWSTSQSHWVKRLSAANRC